MDEGRGVNSLRRLAFVSVVVTYIIISRADSLRGQGPSLQPAPKSALHTENLEVEREQKEEQNV